MGPMAGSEPWTQKTFSISVSHKDVQHGVLKLQALGGSDEISEFSLLFSCCGPFVFSLLGFSVGV